MGLATNCEPKGPINQREQPGAIDRFDAYLHSPLTGYNFKKYNTWLVRMSLLNKNLYQYVKLFQTKTWVYQFLLST